MRRSVGKHEFEDQDFSSILNHARRMEGLTLAAIAEEAQKPKLVEMKGKGAAGQLLQTWFLLEENDNRAEPDLSHVTLPDGRVAGVEIKAVPLMAKKRGWAVKERCKVTSIDYPGLLRETWATSRARHKLMVVLFIFYRYAGAKNWAASRVEKAVGWVLDESVARETIRADWQRTWDYVNSGRAHEISEGHAMILGACTSGAGHEAKHVPQPKNPEAMARKRSFALKPAFLQTAFDRELKPSRFGTITSLGGRQLSGDLQGEILGSLGKHVGKTLGNIADELAIPRKTAKQAAALLVRRALGVVADDKRLLELEAAGVKPKTIPVREKDLWPFEAMSFPGMRLVEFAEEDWEDSELRAKLECLLFIPTLAAKRGQDLWTRKLGTPFFWTPTEEEEAAIAEEWRAFQKQVIDGEAAYERVKGKRVSRLKPGSETKFIHMRPKGPDGTVDDLDPAGNPTQQLCFWLNQQFVQTLLQKHLVRA